MDKELYRYIRDCLARGQRVVLATVVSRSGSAPREAGASLVVAAGGETMGTVGGGILEKKVITAARDVLQHGRSLCLEFSLTAQEVAAGGMLCGGRMEVLVDLLAEGDPGIRAVFASIVTAREGGRTVWMVRSLRPSGREKSVVSVTIPKDTSLPFLRTEVRTGLGLLDEDNLDSGTLEMSGVTVELMKRERRRSETVLIDAGGVRYLLQPVVTPGRVIIAGAGHVARELAMMCNLLELRTVVMDDRREFASRERFPAAGEIVIAAADFRDCFRKLAIDAESGIVIVTRGHGHDRSVLAQALRTGAGYIGMIGSRRKRDAIYLSLTGEGISTEELARVHCPIGLSIGARTPAEIAVSIAAELIAFRAGNCL